MEFIIYFKFNISFLLVDAGLTVRDKKVKYKMYLPSWNSIYRIISKMI